MKHQINSFKVAIKGIWFAVKNESHVRFHLVAGFYVILFSFFYSLSPAQWGLILLLIASILTAELFNTAIEALCNHESQSYDPLIKITKDVAAGAVLILSVVAVAIAIIFYMDFAVISYIFSYFMSHPLLLILFIISFALAMLFIAVGPLGFKNMFYKKRK